MPAVCFRTASLQGQECGQGDQLGDNCSAQAEMADVRRKGEKWLASQWVFRVRRHYLKDWM